jgi:hypothetical protein
VFYSLHSSGALVRYDTKTHRVEPVTTPQDEYLVEAFVANQRLWIRSGAGRLWYQGETPSSWMLAAKNVTATYVDRHLQLTYAAADSVVTFVERVVDGALTRATRLVTDIGSPVCIAISEDTTLVGVNGSESIQIYIGSNNETQIILANKLTEDARLYADARGRVLYLPAAGQQLQLQHPSITDGFRLIGGEYGFLSHFRIQQIVANGSPKIASAVYNPLYGRRDIYLFDERGDTLQRLVVNDVEGPYETIAFGESDTLLVSDAGRFTYVGASERSSRETFVAGHSNRPIRIGGSARQPIFLRRMVSAPIGSLSGIVTWTDGTFAKYLFNDTLIRSFAGSFDQHMIKCGSRFLVVGSDGIVTSDDEGATWDTVLRYPFRLPQFQPPAYRMVDIVDDAVIVIPGSNWQTYVSRDSGRSWRTHHVPESRFGIIRNLWCNDGTYAAHVSLPEGLHFCRYALPKDTLFSRSKVITFGDGPVAISPAGAGHFVVARLLAADTFGLDYQRLEVSFESVDSTIRTFTVELGTSPVWGANTHVLAARPHVGVVGDTLSIFFPVEGRLLRIHNEMILDDRRVPVWMIKPLDGAGQSYIEFTSSSSMRAFTNLNDGIEMFIDYDAEYQEPVSLVDAEVDDALYHVYVKTIEPNPASTDVHISVGHHLRSDLKSLVVRIHDMEGRLIKDIDWHNNIVLQDPYELVVKADVSGLSSGSYVLIVENSQFTHGRVIVIQR